MPKRSKDRDQTKCSPQVLQVGGWGEGCLSYNRNQEALCATRHKQDRLRAKEKGSTGN